MARPIVSAPKIVRDERRFPGDCLRSLAGCVDEVVVVDTGQRLCAFRLRRHRESAAHCARAESLAPCNIEFGARRMLAQTQAGHCT